MRKKSWKQVAAIVICAALLSGCTGENGQKKNTGRKEGQVVNIYCWNDEFKEIYDKYASDLAKKHDVEVNFVIISKPWRISGTGFYRLCFRWDCAYSL